MMREIHTALTYIKFLSSFGIEFHFHSCRFQDLGGREIERRGERRGMMKFLWVGIVISLVFSKWVDGFVEHSVHETELSLLEANGSKPLNNFLMVKLTLIQGAAAKGAVCLDGSLPGYHWHRGHGSGKNSWLIFLEGGGWCNNITDCVNRSNMRLGSSKYMENEIPFSGILSPNATESPDFYNWNRVKIRACDGGSFAGDSENKEAKLHFRGQRIYLAAMEELMSKGMFNANQALLAGCSAGGLACIFHCDQFRDLFPTTTKVKCFSDAGFFLDAVDIAGQRTLRKYFSRVVHLQGLQKNLPRSCTNHLDPTSCFFPQNLINKIKTPLFLLNQAYDSYQVQYSLATPSADPHGYWIDCKLNLTNCSPSQMQFLQGFREQMLHALKKFSKSNKSGLFINSCYAHCEAEWQGAWLANNSTVIGKKTIAIAVGDWYTERAVVKAIDYGCHYNGQ